MIHIMQGLFVEFLGYNVYVMIAAYFHDIGSKFKPDRLRDWSVILHQMINAYYVDHNMKNQERRLRKRRFTGAPAEMIAAIAASSANFLSRWSFLKIIYAEVMVLLISQ